MPCELYKSTSTSRLVISLHPQSETEAKRNDLSEQQNRCSVRDRRNASKIHKDRARIDSIRRSPNGTSFFTLHYRYPIPIFPRSKQADIRSNQNQTIQNAHITKSPRTANTRTVDSRISSCRRRRTSSP